MDRQKVKKEELKQVSAKDLTMTEKQEYFCKLYATEVEFFGNGVQAYVEAYKPDTKKPNWYRTCASAASRLLTNVKVLARINELLENVALNDVHVDKQIAFLITQNADFGAKLGAIREYNNLKQRVTKKLEVEMKGDYENLETSELKQLRSLLQKANAE